ncbi:hypothetical protein B4140_0698 [Bacillus amyloliquefaciens]|nr:hypothetical protein B4140_0698 [Bacillus amyloliquefaciens]
MFFKKNQEGGIILMKRLTQMSRPSIGDEPPLPAFSMRLCI